MAFEFHAANKTIQEILRNQQFVLYSSLLGGLVKVMMLRVLILQSVEILKLTTVRQLDRHILILLSTELIPTIPISQQGYL